MVGNGQFTAAQRDLLARQVLPALVHRALGKEILLAQLFEAGDIGGGEFEQLALLCELVQIRLVTQFLAGDGGIQFVHLAARLLDPGLKVAWIKFEQALPRHDRLTLAHMHIQHAADAGRRSPRLFGTFDAAIEAGHRADRRKLGGDGLHPPDRFLHRRHRRLRPRRFERDEAANSEYQKQHGQQHFFLVHREYGKTRWYQGGRLSDPPRAKQSMCSEYERP